MFTFNSKVCDLMSHLDQFGFERFCLSVLKNENCHLSKRNHACIVAILCLYIYGVMSELENSTFQSTSSSRNLSYIKVFVKKLKFFLYNFELVSYFCVSV